ncbi:DUF998 domain-containing protein [Microbacterium sp. BWT-B31]|uniref:DUF998 domain-containing protein n=1 Tax=Microbacterium sp. BWT-B31 TaxID=3232072 RepID=UPI0035289897
MKGARLAWLSLASLLLFNVMLVTLHFVDRDLDPIVQAISEYALGSFGWLLVVALLVFGLGIILLAAALWTELTNPRPVVGIVFLLVAGIGPIIAAIFRTDPVDLRNPGATELTTSGTLHLVGFMLAVLGIIVAAPIISRRLGAPGNPMSHTIRVIGWTPILAVAIFWASGMLDQPLGVLFDRPSAQGIAERLMVAIVQVWLIAAAIAVIGRSRSVTPIPPASRS